MNAVLGFLVLLGVLFIAVGFALLALLLIDVGTSFLYGGLIIAAPSYLGLVARHIDLEGKK